MHRITLRFRLDQAGGVHDLEVVQSTNPALNESAIQAMKWAVPVFPVPEALVGQPLTLTFTVTVR